MKVRFCVGVIGKPKQFPKEELLSRNVVQFGAWIAPALEKLVGGDPPHLALQPSKILRVRNRPESAANYHRLVTDVK
jgi:hypothetical protein